MPIEGRHSNVCVKKLLLLDYRIRLFDPGGWQTSPNGRPVHTTCVLKSTMHAVGCSKTLRTCSKPPVTPPTLEINSQTSHIDEYQQQVV
jgi:hypothetical protein